MLDLIIPVYKNIPGLYRTLFSISTDLSDKIFVTIVDDCSEEEPRKYDEVISIFQKFFPIRLISLKENGGPGVARQVGLVAATQPYVSFIDCGDVYYTPNSLWRMLTIVEENPDVDMFSFGHWEERPGDFHLEPMGSQHNRMHGKIYRKEYLTSHNINFSAVWPRANEDIGFNICVRLNCSKDGVVYSDHGDPTTIWKWTGPSIVRANDCAYYYKEQNKGLAINCGLAIDNARENGVDEEVIKHEIYQSMITCFMFHLATLHVRPEFLEECVEGSLYYYKNYFTQIPFDEEVFTHTYYDIVNEYLSDRDNPTRAKMASLNIFDWFKMLDSKLEETSEEENK